MINKTLTAPSRDGAEDPIKVRRRWPATMFAASRTASVPGRIKFLILSINTITGISGLGVPLGTRCDITLSNWYTRDHNM